jgi:hypothetical protein
MISASDARMSPSNHLPSDSLMNSQSLIKTRLTFAAVFFVRSEVGS